MEHIYSHMGLKRELYLPKKIREKLGFKPGSKVVCIVKNDKLEVEKVQDVVDVLKRPKFASITPEEFEKWSEKWHKKFLRNFLALKTGTVFNTINN